MSLKVISLSIIGIMITAFALFSLNVTVYAQFEPITESCDGINDSSVCDDLGGNSNINKGESSIFNTIANILAIAGGIIAVIVIIIAGITMIISGGDPQKVSSSRNAIIYAAIGLIVIVLARSLVFFVINLIG